MEYKPTPSLDLELNQKDNKPKIIQIGLCIGDHASERIMHRQTWFVNPHETLEPFIIKLTGIKQSDVDAGVELKDAYEEMVRVMDSFNVDYRGHIVTWGGSDAWELMKELGLHTEHPEWKLGRRWQDAKTLFQAWRKANNLPMQGGLARSMLKLGLRFEGRKHWAEDDSYNTLRAYFALLKKMKE